MRPLLLATRSAGKIAELDAMVRVAGFAVRTLSEFVPDERPEEAALERWPTFEENAIAKARWAFAVTGLPSLADDSGLEVDALDGAPGVQSKRWAGHAESLSGAALDAANNGALLDALAGRLPARARYRCAVAIVDVRGVLIGDGTTAGRIIADARGVGGFGYDPHFESEELGATFASVTRAEKARVSHRARAVAAALRAYQARGDDT